MGFFSRGSLPNHLLVNKRGDICFNRVATSLKIYFEILEFHGDPCNPWKVLKFLEKKKILKIHNFSILCEMSHSDFSNWHRYVAFQHKFC